MLHLPEVTVFCSFVNRTKRVKCGFAEVTGVIESLVFVKSTNRRHLIFSEVEIKQIYVLRESLLLRCLRDNCGTSLNSPSKDNLGWSLIVFGCNVGQDLMGEDGVTFFRHTKLEVGRSSQVAECHHLDFVRPAEAMQFLNCVVGMRLDLENGRLDLGVLKYLAKHGGADVAAAYVTYEALCDELLHGLIGLLVSNTSVIKVHGWFLFTRVKQPLCWVSCLDGNKFERDWEVN